MEAAARHYRVAIETLRGFENQNYEAKNLVVNCLQNLSLVLLKLSGEDSKALLEEAVESASMAIKFDVESVKAIYLRGQAYMK